MEKHGTPDQKKQPLIKSNNNSNKDFTSLEVADISGQMMQEVESMKV